MVAVPTRSHELAWLAPQSLWSPPWSVRGATGNGAFNQPAILRFRNDEFMDELVSLLAHEPHRLGEWLALPETWRSPQPAPAAVRELRQAGPPNLLSQRVRSLAPVASTTALEALDDALPLKLYQPAHQRFYLVGATLVCRQAGLPGPTTWWTTPRSGSSMATSPPKTVSYGASYLTMSASGRWSAKNACRCSP
jgi:hypothetical protein